MNWTEFLIGFFSSAVGSLGFALIFRLNRHYLLQAALGGGIAFSVYYVGMVLQGGLFAANFAAGIAAALFSECCARWLKAPAVLFSIPCIIPLVPGGMLYYTMSYLFQGDITRSSAYLRDTLLTSVGIVGGLIVVSLFFTVLSQSLQKRREERQKDN